MEAERIRRAFLDFFQQRDHLEVASAPLVAPGDPTLLFTSAGMVPFRPYFLGREAPPQRRLVSIQKCFRTTDIDDVGDDSHLTFFEMMGNFAFADYFKAEAQAWAWELVTADLGIPAERLVATVYVDDDDAYEIWRKVGVPAERIFRYGADQGNFWSAGVNGPCGPCSEIHYDMRPETGGAHPGPAADARRYLEIWNLVFMQFQQNPDGSQTPLPTQNIDTGAGLERWAMMMQGKTSLYETDLFAPLLAYVADRCGRSYQESGEEERRALRVIVEHGRAMTFLISDGTLPSNEGRGYVLRRLIRRALYMAQTLGIEEQILPDVAAEVRDQMGEAYPELREQAPLVERVLDGEEERFRRTLATGQALLEARILPAIRAAEASEPVLAASGDAGEAGVAGGAEQLVAAAQRQTVERRRAYAEAALQIPGAVAFALYDTYGFPPELTREVAARAGLDFDQDGFEKAMEEQRRRGRAASEFRAGEMEAVYAAVSGSSEFLGYEDVRARGRVLALVTGGAAVERVEEGAAVEVVLERTPFYPEGGGQTGDAGRLLGPGGEVRVRDTQSRGDLIAHLGEVVRGSLANGDAVEAEVDVERRRGLMRNHTATHLLHAALRRVLGEHVRQAGSLVAPERLRFDYTQLEPPGREQLATVERLVKGAIRQDIGVGTRQMPFEKALQAGAIAIFGEKYGGAVRVVEICDPDPALHDCFSKELCGGTHVAATGFIGEFQIVSEGSVGAGLRRIEALTGAEAEAWQRQRLDALAGVAERLRSSPLEAVARVQALQEELAAVRRRLAQVDREAGASAAATLAAEVREVDGVAVVAGRVEVESAAALRRAGDEVRQRLGSGVIVLGAVAGERPLFVAMVSRGLTESGLHAGQLLKEVARVVGGGGGGSAEMAQAGGTDAGKLEEALAAVPEIVRRQRAG